ncbi:hypothetical protein Aph01nite_60230 [Acrocarpospora phusangensis]|uniref:Uncharacterized protein n=1 Tax=Acrocarpospora phusangensis TaxID=1070424 RepID=A0A919QFB2_9ACTN|nr:hypothetical protein Aph01nite_60230 [Acrocarpospora phusangensis]
MDVALAGERAIAFDGERRRRIEERRRQEEDRRRARAAAHASRLARERERLSARLVALARRTEALAGIRVSGTAEDERQGVLRTLAVLGTRLARVSNQADADAVHIDLVAAARRLEAVRAGLAAALAEDERLAALSLVETRLAEWDDREALDADGAQAVADQLAAVRAGVADTRTFRFGYARLNELVGDHLTLVARRTALLAEARDSAQEAGEALTAILTEADALAVELPGREAAQEVRDLLAAHLAAGRFQEAAHGAVRLAGSAPSLEKALEEHLDHRELTRHVTEAAAQAGLVIVEVSPAARACRLAYRGELTADVLARLRADGVEPGSP